MRDKTIIGPTLQASENEVVSNGCAEQQRGCGDDQIDENQNCSKGRNHVTFDPIAAYDAGDHDDNVLLDNGNVFGNGCLGADQSGAVRAPLPSLSRRRGASLTLDLDGQKLHSDHRRSSVPRIGGHQNEDGENEDLVDYQMRNKSVDHSFVRDTERVVQSYLVSCYERDTEKQNVLPADEHPSADLLSPGSSNDTPIIPELVEHLATPDSRAAIVLIGRRLAFIGDELDAYYGAQLEGMVVQILPDIISSTEAILEHAYFVFQRVANRLFQDGKVTWCRIVVLLTFGYRLGIALFRHGVHRFVRMIVQLITKFILKMNIHSWIMQRGGWLAALTCNMDNNGTNVNSLFCVYLIWSATALAMLFALHRSITGGSK